jgi:hypothetical protein
VQHGCRVEGPWGEARGNGRMSRRLRTSATVSGLEYRNCSAARAALPSDSDDRDSLHEFEIDDKGTPPARQRRDLLRPHGDSR